jgi:hypothetical protein
MRFGMIRGFSRKLTGTIPLHAPTFWLAYETVCPCCPGASLAAARSISSKAATGSRRSHQFRIDERNEAIWLKRHCVPPKQGTETGRERG